jgi:hypothetical protein
MREADFSVSSEGAVVEYEPQAVQTGQRGGPLTRHQRATIYFKALRLANKLLQSVGFHAVVDCGHRGFSLEQDGFMLEMMVKEAPQMAHVTSYPGYVYDPDKITAKVTMACPAPPGEYVIQAIASQPSTGTLPPVFITVRPDAKDVLKETFMSILSTAHLLISKNWALADKIKNKLRERRLDEEFEQLSLQDVESESRTSASPAVGRAEEAGRSRACGRGDYDAIPV